MFNKRSTSQHAVAVLAVAKPKSSWCNGHMMTVTE
jgi:hypothetical protein